MKTFLGSSISTGVMALALTPEMATAVGMVIPAIIAALLMGAVNLYMAHTSRLVQMKEIAKAIAPVESKIDALKPVVDKIDLHVNGEKTKANSELIQRDIQIELQREMIDELKKAAALLAQAKATTEMSSAVAQAAIAGAATPGGKTT